MAHRIFFGLALAGGALAVLAQALGGVASHAHEMLFGQALAVVAGFLLTRLSPATLGAIVAAWCAARLVQAVPETPAALRAALSLTATGSIALTTGYSFLRGVKQASNLVFPTVCFGFVLAEALYQLGALGALRCGTEAGRWLALGFVVLLIVAMGGRILGAAASGAAQRAGGGRLAPRPWLERLLLALLAAGFGAEALAVPYPMGPALIGAGAALICLRLASWAPGLRRSAGDVVALAAGQAWLGLGLMTWAAAAGGHLPSVPPTAALHLAMVGGIGGTMLVMAMRAAAQRERRSMPVRAAPAVAGLMGGAALLRGIGGPELLGAAALLWVVASMVAAATVFGRR